jgi:hypothetical protein
MYYKMVDRQSTEKKLHFTSRLCVAWHSNSSGKHTIEFKFDPKLSNRSTITLIKFCILWFTISKAGIISESKKSKKSNSEVKG